MWAVREEECGDVHERPWLIERWSHNLHPVRHNEWNSRPPSLLLLPSSSQVNVVCEVK